MSRSIKPYEATVAELKSYKKRLQTLLDRKEELLQMALPASPSLEENKGTGDGHSKQERYVYAITEINDATGFSLEDEIDYTQKQITRLEQDLEVIKIIFNKPADVETDLEIETIVKGTNITKAVSKVAERNYMSESTVWRKWRKRKHGRKTGKPI